jgi:hypothetical protein
MQYDQNIARASACRSKLTLKITIIHANSRLKGQDLARKSAMFKKYNQLSIKMLIPITNTTS